ncbi:TPA: hypothetical protein N3D36_004863 [Salmonella enterica subsp. enterica serovar Lehrte]|nr:hypothetical protein [Salmonella enterica subsp. enterica serovar Lehrte]HCM2495630.1 hypothetical protein [Salmonella enterica subsp. enterica serovar Lehrte]
MNANELMSIIQQLAEWHKNRVEMVRLITQKKDADIEIPELNITLAADSREANWLRVGAIMALSQFEKFPVSFGEDQAADGECDDK